jgi:Ni,Fe-hydrogenase III small subunit
MFQWVSRGLRTGIKTSRYPAKQESGLGVSPGLPLGGTYDGNESDSLIARCPTQAFSQSDGRVIVNYRRCVHCYRCERQVEPPAGWTNGYEWAAANGEVLGNQFARSVHILVVDAGDCGTCLHEVKQLNNPYYNMHRLGFFLTPTPRHADVLLVVGPVTDHMRVALEKTYQAMPTPKRVVAVGACALSGGVFGPSFVSEGGVAKVIPVDVEVPGQPPPPLAILHGLLVAVGRKGSASLISSASLASSPTTPLLEGDRS